MNVGGIALCLAAVAWSATPAVAANTANGARLANQWCASCHIVDGNRKGPIQEGPPSFRAVAHSGMTPRRLHVFLLHPHGGMPNLSLSRVEIDDLVAYIESLR